MKSVISEGDSLASCTVDELEDEFKDGGEVTPGVNLSPYHRVVPRIVGAQNVARFKALWGVCPSVGCNQGAGHPGDCPP